ncbi:membrane-associated phospholipid phosphatase [Wenyingzhuangia heitensis]|uniref:Membrane-associated phospholipid phosphatase n=1 Tax=Wenyingzhuangia heitensis TaxID=1487859 RepID=A0ABX0U8Y8_9FLAO|nr:phosphatase PAP2 family protein [Wenyingzhuangia heitensis]NIJ44673.1 membrane-associated phospholipid phosphatase [Wenyingzhuangia heitensis]
MEKHKQLYVLVLVLVLSFRTQAQSTIEKIGDYGLYSMPIIALSSTIIEKDLKGTFMFGKGFVLNTVLTLGLKEVVKKERPNDEDLNSFPSGHTSVTFQSAAFMQKRYGWKYGIPAYTIAAYTGFSRVYADKHFVEDVAVGAVIGIISSYIFTKKRSLNTTSFSFDKQGKDFYLSYSYQF